MARPRIPLLSKPIIRDTALKLVDEHGLTDFSMRKLATVLGVQAPSLYSHYADKDELLDDVANVIMESVDVSGFDSDDWRGALAHVGAVLPRGPGQASQHRSLLGLRSERQAHRPRSRERHPRRSGAGRMAAAHGNADRRFRQVRGHGCCDSDVLRRIRGRSGDSTPSVTRTSRERTCCASVLRKSTVPVSNSRWNRCWTGWKPNMHCCQITSK